VALLDTLPDVDRAEDVADAETALAAETPTTGSLVSVVVPALDDADEVGAAVSSSLAAGAAEVLVVDAGSADGTAAAARNAGARVLDARMRGRAVQMNAGAAAAGGDVLCFLHADSRLPAGFAPLVVAALGRPGVAAAAFDFGVGGRGWRSALIGSLGALRWRLSRLPYGDQGVCMTRVTFELLGGFPAQPTMEDYEMALRLRHLGRIARVPLPVVTSTRTWDEHGLLLPTAVNLAVIAGYRLGAPPERLAAWRRRIAPARRAT
jgi:rSAM/selenodomain-associated transferase 2